MTRGSQILVHAACVCLWSHLYLVSNILFLYCDGFLLSSPDLILGGSYRTQIMLSNSGCMPQGFKKCQKLFFKSSNSQALYLIFFLVLSINFTWHLFLPLTFPKLWNLIASLAARFLNLLESFSFF